MYVAQKKYSSKDEVKRKRGEIPEGRDIRPRAKYGASAPDQGIILHLPGIRNDRQCTIDHILPLSHAEPRSGALSLHTELYHRGTEMKPLDRARGPEGQLSKMEVDSVEQPCPRGPPPWTS